MFMNTSTYEEYIMRDAKRLKMYSSQNNSLLLDVPQEILQIYSRFLDLKSTVMFHTACKRTYNKKTITQSKHNTVSRMLSSISYMMNELYDIFGTVNGQYKLLANMLRKIIYVSVSDLPNTNECQYVSSRTLNEYNKLIRLAMDTLDISELDFNSILEDIQFEYRGFEIVNICKERRDLLNKVKDIIHKHYFSHEFTVYTYTTFGNIFLEFQCDKDKIMIDVHERLTDDVFSWSFLTDVLKSFMVNNPNHELVIKMKNSGIEIKDNMITSNKGDYNAIHVIAEIINELQDCSSIFKGSDDNIVEIWNDTIEVNWVLKDVVREILKNGMYSFMLRNITNAVQDDFYPYLDIDEQLLLL